MRRAGEQQRWIDTPHASLTTRSLAATRKASFKRSSSSSNFTNAISAATRSCASAISSKFPAALKARTVEKLAMVPFRAGKNA